MFLAMRFDFIIGVVARVNTGCERGHATVIQSVYAQTPDKLKTRIIAAAKNRISTQGAIQIDGPRGYSSKVDHRDAMQMKDILASD